MVLQNPATNHQKFPSTDKICYGVSYAILTSTLLLAMGGKFKARKWKGMVGMENKAKVIMLKNDGLSNREVARQVGINRETVSKYWEEYKRKRSELMSSGKSVDEC